MPIQHLSPRITPHAQVTSPLKRQFGRSLSVLLLSLGAFSATNALAQAFPTKPLRLVVTFPSGGAPDILARLFSEKAQLGFPVVVDNRPGAGGNIGADNVAKSPGDGHTLVMGTVGTHSINGALYEKMPYDMVKGFSPISLIASAPNLLVVNNALPVKNVPELIAYMKANPHNLSAPRCMSRANSSNRSPAPPWSMCPTRAVNLPFPT